MSAHIPTTKQAEGFLASDGTEQPAARSHDRAEFVTEFRRWLEQHDRETAARAWEDGHSWGWSDAQDYIAAELGPLALGDRVTYKQRMPNPHEQEES